jgi:hypothetical protein
MDLLSIIPGATYIYDRIKKNVESSRKLKMPAWQAALLEFGAGPLIAGKILDYRVEKRDERLATASRTASGLAGDAALRKTAKANKEMLNAQLVNTTANINREFANAGRYASGQRGEAILQANESANTALAQANAANAQRMYEFQTTTDEQRAWNQAQLDSKQTSKADIVGQILGIGTEAYIKNPEQTKSDLSWLGSKLGLGGGGGGTFPASEGATSEAMSLFGETAVPSNIFVSETEPSLATSAPPRQTTQDFSSLLFPKTSAPPQQQRVFDYPDLDTMSQDVKNMSLNDFMEKHGADPVQAYSDFSVLALDYVPNLTWEDSAQLTELLQRNLSPAEVMHQWVLYLRKKGLVE